MRAFSRIVLAFVFFAGQVLLAHGFATAGESDAQNEVIVTGLGANADAALKNALRSAVNQVVGSLVSADQLVANDKLVRDEILTYSDGFVESHRVIGDPAPVDGGLIEIRIAAVVRRIALTKKLEGLKIITAPIDGENLFAEMFTKKQAAAEAEQMRNRMVQRAFDGFPENIMDIAVRGKPSFDDATKKVVVEVDVAVNRTKHRAFVEALTEMLQRLDVSPTSYIIGVSGSNNARALNFTYEPANPPVGPHIYTGGKSLFGIPDGLAICTDWPADIGHDGNSAWNFYAISAESLDDLRRVRGPYALFAEIVDGEGSVVATTQAPLTVPVTFGPDHGRNNVIRTFGNHIHIFPVLAKHSLPQNQNQNFGYDRETTIKIAFDVPAEHMRRMQNVRISMARADR